MRRVLQNLIIAFTVIFLFTGMFLCENQNMWKQVDSIQVT